MSEPFRGQIRKEDVRATEKDRVEMYKSFRSSVGFARLVLLVLYSSDTQLLGQGILHLLE